MTKKRAIGLVALFLMFDAAVVVALRPELEKRRRERQEAAAVRSLGAIAAAQESFLDAENDPEGKRAYGSLADLARASLVDPALGTGTKEGYVFRCEPSRSHPRFVWWASARPLGPAEGRRVFFVNQGLYPYGIDLADPRSVADPDPDTAAIPTGGCCTDAHFKSRRR